MGEPAHRTVAERGARVWGTLALWLAVLAAWFFPLSAAAGTETQVERAVVAIALAVAGLAMRRSDCRDAAAAVAAAALAVGVVWTGGWWLAAFAALLPVCVLVVHVAERWLATHPSDEEHGHEVVASIAVALILALVFREFVVEAFKIPTGSMQPTIFGDSGQRASVPLLSDIVRAVQFKDPAPGRRGDRLLAAKAPLLFGEPERWSIMVFKFPLFRPTNFIKRLVGLPGETIEIRDGDIYVGGVVSAKPDEVQESLWFPLLPSGEGEWARGVAGSFVADGPGRWTLGDDDSASLVPAGGTGWIVHDTGVPDVRVSFDVEAEPTDLPAVHVRIDGAGRRVAMEMDSEGLWVEGPGVERRRVAGAHLGAGRSKGHVAFAVADRVVRVWLDGHLVARVGTADATNVEGRANQVWIGASGGGATTFRGIRIERDLQYTREGPGRWQVPPGCYFMLGDNTGSSRDSRRWDAMVYRTRDGRTYVGDDSVRLDDEHAMTNNRDLGDAWEVWDADGVRRVIAKADLAGPPRREPQPFVRREDLVGRALVVFFPFPPFGEFRPRILP